MKCTSTASLDERKALSEMVTKLFAHWQLSRSEQLSLLGISSQSSLTRYRKGAPLPKIRDTLDRVGHLFAIHMKLRLLFPHHRDTAYQWVSLRNRAFDNYSPVEVMVTHGYVGILMVRTYLDRAVSR